MTGELMRIGITVFKWIMIQFTNWSITVNNNCENSQTYFDSFNTGCNGELFETCITRSCDDVPTDLFVDNIIHNRVTLN